MQAQAGERQRTVPQLQAQPMSQPMPQKVRVQLPE
jgi:hypothetical protein